MLALSLSLQAWGVSLRETEAPGTRTGAGDAETEAPKSPCSVPSCLNTESGFYFLGRTLADTGGGDSRCSED